MAHRAIETLARILEDAGWDEDQLAAVLRKLGRDPGGWLPKRAKLGVRPYFEDALALLHGRRGLDESFVDELIAALPGRRDDLSAVRDQLPLAVSPNSDGTHSGAAGVEGPSGRATRLLVVVSAVGATLGVAFVAVVLAYLLVPDPGNSDRRLDRDPDTDTDTYPDPDTDTDTDPQPPACSVLVVGAPSPTDQEELSVLPEGCVLAAGDATPTRTATWRATAKGSECVWTVTVEGDGTTPAPRCATPCYTGLGATGLLCDRCATARLPNSCLNNLRIALGGAP